MLRRRPRVTLDQVLGSCPLRNHRVRSEQVEEGGLRLFIERKRDWWVRLLAVVLPIPRQRIVELDAVGEEVWQLCDGNHTLREMIRMLEQRHKLTRGEAEWSLRSYLRDLGKRGLVVFVVDRRQEHQAEAKGARTHGEDA